MARGAAKTDLFDVDDDTGSRGYSAKDIEVLEGLEPVRRRPGMYIGGTDERALHHLAAEIVDNAMEAQADRIDIVFDTPSANARKTRQRKNAVTAVAFIDNGAGMGERMAARPAKTAGRHDDAHLLR